MSLLANIQAAIGAIGADIKALPSRFAALSGSSEQPFRVGSATKSQHAVPLGQLQTLFPQAGSVSYFAMSSAPSGWLKANGAAISRTTYSALFAAIGTTFGAGDGSTTFNLPDLRGEFLRGWDDGRGVDSGRAISTWQAPSLITAYTGPDALHGLVVEGATVGTSTNAEFNAAMQTDTIADANYSSALKGYAYIMATYAYSGNSAGRTNDSTANRPLNNNNYFQAGGARPRNIALLACIKY